MFYLSFLLSYIDVALAFLEFGNAFVEIVGVDSVE